MEKGEHEGNAYEGGGAEKDAYAEERGEKLAVHGFE
jgi:hypothetical protein